jgi:integrase
MVSKRDFTDRFLKALRPAEAGKRVIIYDAQIPGFGIRTTDRSSPEDKGTFVLVTRFPGSNNPVPRRIGDYPAMSLAKAREIARAWREDIRRGVDPKVKETERRREEERRRADTFAAAFEAYADEHLSTLRTGKEVKRAIRNYVLGSWGARPITEIGRADVANLIRSLRKNAPVAANRTLSYLKTFFSWCVDQELIEASPAAAIKRPAKELKRDRVLTNLELRAIWTACGDLGLFGGPVKMMLATAQRRSEVGETTWREIDKEQRVWRLARERTKAARAHEVPLSDLALAILDETPKVSDFVFASGRAAGAVNGWSKAKRRLDDLAAKKLLELAPETDGMLREWRLHDLRRTAATYMAKLGVDRVVIGKVLNHAEPEVTAIYDRHRYDLEKRRALELWAARLKEIVELAPSGNVVSLPDRVSAS